MIRWPSLTEEWNRNKKVKSIAQGDAYPKYGLKNENWTTYVLFLQWTGETKPLQSNFAPVMGDINTKIPIWINETCSAPSQCYQFNLFHNMENTNTQRYSLLCKDEQFYILEAHLRMRQES